MRTILQTILFISFVSISILYVIFLYEKLSGREQIKASSFVLTYVKEIISFFFIILTWILGFISIESFLPRKRTGLSTPIFLIPGFMLTKSSMLFIFLMLRNRGFENIFILNPFPPLGKIEEIAHNILKTIKDICEIIGMKEITLIGHSTGGLVARYIASKDEEFGLKVRRCVTLGTPNRGTKVAYLIPFGQHIKQVRPDSSVISYLNEIKKDCVSLIGEHDEFVLPADSESVQVRNVGHFSILFSSDAIDIIHRSVADVAVGSPVVNQTS